jgi:hypothetical protein
LKVGDVGYNFRGHQGQQEIHRGHCETLRLKIFYIFSNQGPLGSMVGRMLENIRKDKIICS